MISENTFLVSKETLKSIYSFNIYFMPFNRINILNFLDYISNDNPHDNQTIGQVGWLNIDVNRSLNSLDKIINFNQKEIEMVKNLGLQNYKYSLNIEPNFLSITDIDPKRRSINPSYGNWTKSKYGNSDQIWIYKIEDDWFLSIISRSNIIPFHKNPYVMANRNSNFEFYKCDQIEGLIDFLKIKLCSN